MQKTSGMNPFMDAVEERAFFPPSLEREPKALKPFVEKLAQSRIVMLGESSHGTHEYYEWRRILSQWLISQHGFNFIAVEGDWPPCQTLNRYITQPDRFSAPGSAREALEAFDRWPTWMWANTEIIRMAEWLREQNSREKQRGGQDLTGFHGLDVYSLFESIEVVLEKMESINPFLARRLRKHYGCFDFAGGDEKNYARSLLKIPEGCEDDVIQALTDLQRQRLKSIESISTPEESAFFDAIQNARVVKNAENYYRTMMLGDEDSWNVRDRHMLETLDVLLDRYGPDSKVIVWAHNTHIGDYRATPMADYGQINLGGLAREHFGDSQVSLVGFGTYTGSVVASHAWGGPIQKLRVPKAREGSLEFLLHQACRKKAAESLLLSFSARDRQGVFSEVYPHRAIGVVYDPEHERLGNYVPTSLARRYDHFIFLDETRALTPLIEPFAEDKIPETWPMGQ